MTSQVNFNPTTSPAIPMPEINSSNQVIVETPMSTQNQVNGTSLSVKEHDQNEIYLEQIKYFLTHPRVRKLVAAGLTAQGLYGLYQSLHFITVEFPELEEKLVSHSIQTMEVNSVAVQAVFITASTVITMLFALRITVIQTKAAKAINTLFGVMIFLANTIILNYLNQLPLVELWTKFVNWSLMLKSQIF